jgi:hypothetical protein
MGGYLTKQNPAPVPVQPINGQPMAAPAPGQAMTSQMTAPAPAPGHSIGGRKHRKTSKKGKKGGKRSKTGKKK